MVSNRGGRVVVNYREVDRLVHSSDVARDLGRRAEIGTQEAKRLAPVSPAGHDGMGPGHLRSSIGWTLGEDGDGVYADIGTDAEEALYVEFGTAPHVIRSTGPWPLRNAGGDVFGQEVDHPGTDAQPFLRPGLDKAAGANT